jgi:putative ABC transport system permease protein
MVLNKRIKRVLFENKAQYIGIAVLIIISSFLFTYMGQFAGNFKRLAYNFTENYIIEDASFETDRKIENLEKLEATSDALIEEYKTADYKLSDELTIRLLSNNKKINLTAVTEGEGLQQAGDILLNPVFAKSNNLDIGEKISIFDETFVIRGLFAIPNYMYILESDVDLMPSPTFGIGVISKSDMDKLPDGNVHYHYAVKFNSTNKGLREQTVEYRKIIENEGISITQWTNADDNKRINIVEAEVEIIKTVANGVPTGVLILTIIIICGIISRLINNESTIVGTLYALGYKKGEIYFHYLLLIFFIVFPCSIIGSLLGTLPVEYIVRFILEAFNIPLTSIVIEPKRLAYSILIPVLFITFSSSLVIHKKLKRSPVDLMRGKIENIDVNFLERAIKLDKLKFSLKFKIREQLRSISRVAFLLFGIAVATVLMQWGFSLKTSTNFLFEENTIYNFKYEYKFNQLQKDTLPNGAEPFAASLFLPEDNEKKDFYITGIPENSNLISLEDESGAKINTNQVVVTKPVSRVLNAKVGDSIKIVRKLDGEIFKLKIDAIAETYAGRFIFMPLHVYNEYFGMPTGSYNGAFSNILLDIPDGKSFSMTSLEDKKAGAEELFAQVESMVGMVVFLAFIIGLIVIYLVTSMIVGENTHTISLMKIFGYHKKEINSLILNSSTLVVILGYVIGLPLTTSAIGVLTQSLEDSIGMVVPPASISLQLVLIGFVVVMLAFELSKQLCRKKVNAISMNEILKSGVE